MPDAFKDCDGKTVPLVWQHVHDDVDNVLGHAELECRPDGVYAYCTCNSTPKGQNAKELVKHGDICALSIYANKLQQVGQNVMHGVIREVSLVLAGANPGATIDNLAFAHSDGTKAIIEDEACMSFVDDSFKIIMHSDGESSDDGEGSDETIGDILDTMTEKQRQAVYALVGSIVDEDDEDDEDEIEHSDDGDDPLDSLDEEQEDALDEIIEALQNDEDLPEDLEDIFDTFTEEQKDAVYDLVDSDEDEDEDEDEDDYEDEEEGDDLQHSGDETIQDVLDTLDEDQEDALQEILHSVSSGKPASEDAAEIFDTFTSKQKNAVYAMIGLASESGGSVQHSDDGETIKDVIDTLDDEQKDALDDILDAIGAGRQVSPEVAEVFGTFSDKQKEAVYGLVGLAAEGGDEIQHADQDDIEDILDGMDDEQLAAIEAILTAVENGEDSVAAEVKDIVDNMTDEQRETVQALIDAAQEDDESDEEDEEDDEDYEEMEHSEFEGELMKYNIFENEAFEGAALSHDDMKAVFDDAPRYGSLKEAALQHGITDIEVLFPEAQAVNKQPYQIARRMEWVSTVLNGVHKNPFSRIKSTAVNLTEDQARAKGYIKGRKKIEEQISALRRVTTPQTIYKLQKLDRDDVVDITDFDVVAFMKQEMRMMLDEEIARAILVGDGRVGSDPEKIFPEHVRPVWTDDEMYTIHKVVAAANASDYGAMIDEVVRARKAYKGSGNPIMFIGPDILTEMRLLKDQDNRFRYDSDAKLAEAMRVSKIEEVELFDELTRSVEGKNRKLVAIILNLADYTVGADKGGEVTMFDDFDIDYNKMSYLIETRMSGALTQPKSAIAVEIQTTTDSTPEVVYVKVNNPLVADIDDYYEQDEYGRYFKTVDVAIVSGKTYYEIDEA